LSLQNSSRQNNFEILCRDPTIEKHEQQKGKKNVEIQLLKSTTKNKGKKEKKKTVKLIRLFTITQGAKSRPEKWGIDILLKFPKD
jgi:hypothetical protein